MTTNEQPAVLSPTPSQVSAGAKVAAGFAIAVFVVGLIGWVWVAPGLESILQETFTHPDPGDAAIGILYLAIMMGVVSFMLLALAVPLAWLARALPTWLRALTIVSPALGLVVTVLLLMRCYM
jgi:hypothetical protein